LGGRVLDMEKSQRELQDKKAELAAMSATVDAMADTLRKLKQAREPDADARLLRQLDELRKSPELTGAAAQSLDVAVELTKQRDASTQKSNLGYEALQNDIQELQQMQKSLSNVLDTMDEQTKNSIRRIRG
jgi:hypothetical protein